MRTSALLLATALLAAPVVAVGEPLTTQTRTGLGTGEHPINPTNSLPAGSENATTGPQAQPAYPSGSTTPNPGGAQVQAMPVPAAGAVAAPTGVVETSPGAAAATQEGAAVAPPGGK